MNDLWAEISGLTGLAEAALRHAALVFLRVGGAIMLLPALGEQALPMRVKLALALALVAVIAPAAPGADLTAGTLISEALVGLLLGFSLRLMIWGLQTAGTLAAQSVSLSQMFSGAGPESQPIVSNMLVLAGVALFVVSGGLARSAELILLSYQLMPPGQPLDAGEIATWGLDRIARVFGLSFTLAAPFVLAALLYNLALGAINRAMPALMVTFIGAPALTLGGLVLLALAVPMLLQVWHAALLAVLAAPFGP